MNLSVVKDLQRIRGILLDIEKRPDCAEITAYNALSIRIFREGGLDRAIKHYKSEA
ncbi:unnamed protein product, partial [marine sediment metagenome]